MSNYVKKISLQQLKQELLNVQYSEDKETSLPVFQKNIHCLFGSDNSFLFVKQKNTLEFSFHNLFLLGFIFGDPILYKMYYLVDYFTKTRVSDFYDDSFCDGDIIKNNKVDYYIISLTKIVPASRLEKLTSSNLRKIQDEINVYLANNPDFISTLFEEQKNQAHGGRSKEK